MLPIASEANAVGVCQNHFVSTWCNRREAQLGMTSSGSAEVKYDFTPANPDPGDDYDKWRQNALNAMATGDDRG